MKIEYMIKIMMMSGVEAGGENRIHDQDDDVWFVQSGVEFGGGGIRQETRDSKENVEGKVKHVEKWEIHIFS